LSNDGTVIHCHWVKCRKLLSPVCRQRENRKGKGWFFKREIVLVVSPAQINLPKLMPRWTGAYRMTKTINDWINEVEHLVTAKKSEFHTRFSSNHTLNMHFQLTEQIQHEELELHV
jgi:hypothetical protein